MRSRNVRFYACAALFALALLVVAPTFGASKGNAANAHLCQKGGWAALVRSSDGSGFKNAGDCVNHGAHGGAVSLLEVRGERAACPLPNMFCLEATGFGLLPGSTVTLFSDQGSGLGFSLAIVGADGVLPRDVLSSRTICGTPQVIRFSAYAVGTTTGGAPFTSPIVSGEIACG